MKLTLFQVDAFSNKVFGGNPAAVVPLERWLPDELLQSIAIENNLSETAFFVGEAPSYHLRWFTPAAEVRLCGHATLATAHTLFAELGYTESSIAFETQAGTLHVQKTATGYQMDFPADPPQTSELPDLLRKAIDVPVIACLHGLDDFLIILESQAQIEQLKPRLNLVEQLEDRGLVVSAPGNEVDFVSRCFFPKHNIPEDPVTGSAHTMMAPYWAQRLGKNTLSAIQWSARKGHLQCTVQGDRVLLEGQACTYLRGAIYVP